MNTEQNEYRTIWLTWDECAFESTAKKYFGPDARLGRWHEKPRDNEELVGGLRVRRTDPDFPVFVPKV